MALQLWKSLAKLSSHSLQKLDEILL